VKNNLFIEIDKDINANEQKTEGGILLPGEEKTKIVDVAIAGENELGIKAGDKVLLNPNASFLEFRIGAKWYQMVPVGYVVAILE
jgi:co-chaperonin GroES (HSP10)